MGGEDPFDGLAMTKKMWNKTFHGIGTEIVLSPKGDRVFDFYLLGFDVVTNEFSVSPSHAKFLICSTTEWMSKVILLIDILACHEIYGCQQLLTKRQNGQLAEEQKMAATEYSAVWLRWEIGSLPRAITRSVWSMSASFDPPIFLIERSASCWCFFQSEFQPIWPLLLSWWHWSSPVA
jgi:hypothetical protein